MKLRQIILSTAIVAAQVMVVAPASAEQPLTLPNQGVVVSSINGAGYSYVEVSNEGETRWLAAPEMKLSKGQHIRYSDGAAVPNFHSETLNRSFPLIYFVDYVKKSEAEQ